MGKIGEDKFLRAYGAYITFAEKQQEKRHADDRQRIQMKSLMDSAAQQSSQRSRDAAPRALHVEKRVDRTTGIYGVTA